MYISHMSMIHVCVTHCSKSRHIDKWIRNEIDRRLKLLNTVTHCNMHHAATRCNTLQHTATHCNTLQHAVPHCNTLQHTRTYCNTRKTRVLDVTATHYTTLRYTAIHCNTLQHTATHCNTLQHTATHCNAKMTGILAHFSHACVLTLFLSVFRYICTGRWN